MANLSISYDELTGSATKLTNGREQINALLGSLQAHVQQLVQSGFVTDRSSGAFQASYERFTSGARETVAGLDGLAGFLTQAAATMQDLDAQLAARLR